MNEITIIPVIVGEEFEKKTEKATKVMDKLISWFMESYPKYKSLIHSIASYTKTRDVNELRVIKDYSLELLRELEKEITYFVEETKEFYDDFNRVVNTTFDKYFNKHYEDVSLIIPFRLRREKIYDLVMASPVQLMFIDMSKIKITVDNLMPLDYALRIHEAVEKEIPYTLLVKERKQIRYTFNTSPDLVKVLDMMAKLTKILYLMRIICSVEEKYIVEAYRHITDEKARYIILLSDKIEEVANDKEYFSKLFEYVILLSPINYLSDILLLRRLEIAWIGYLISVERVEIPEKLYDFMTIISGHLDALYEVVTQAKHILRYFYEKVGVEQWKK